jgi:general secretion pathway protein N
MAGAQMKTRRPIGVVVVAWGIIAAVAGFAIAANDPHGFEPRVDDNARPSPLTLAPDAGAVPPSASEPPLRRNPLWGISLQSLSATRERPLFSPSRRPPAQTVVAPSVAPLRAAPGEPTRPPLDLLGVVTGTDEGYAVFINTATHDIVRLRTGEGHEGWILQSVKSREVALEKNHRTAVVTLPQPNADKK